MALVHQEEKKIYTPHTQTQDTHAVHTNMYSISPDK